jgi:hypothetical protein
LKSRIDHPFYSLSGKNNLRYKDKAFAKRGSKRYKAFEEKGKPTLTDKQRDALAAGRKARIQLEPPTPLEANTAAPSQADLDHVQQELKPPTPMRRPLD